jgi:hypothetical protein
LLQPLDLRTRFLQVLLEGLAQFLRGAGFSHNGTTGSNSQVVDYAASWKRCTTQSHMRRSRP